MDPLSVTASIVGILAAAGKLSELLHTTVCNAREAPKVVTTLGSEINDIRAALLSLQGLITYLSSSAPRRTALIQLDQLVVTLTESVLAFSELEAIITPLAVPNGELFPLRARLKWTRVERNCSKMVEKLQRHKASISLMLNILQCASDAEASRSQQSLQSLVEQLLQSNQELSKRLRTMEDVFDARSMITKKFSGHSILSGRDDETIRTARSAHKRDISIIETIQRFTFDEDLESSRAYKRAKHDSCDHSFVSSTIRTSAWSIFSGLSLADISVVSVVALPLYPGDIKNKEHYTFGDAGVAQCAHTNPYRTFTWDTIEFYEQPRYIYHCIGCEKILHRGPVFEIGGLRWHIDCFRCDTCALVLGSNYSDYSNLTLLSDGSLECNNCIYFCGHCTEEVENLAVVIPDQALCRNCFRCGNCGRKIQNMRYARISQDIFCISCQEWYLERRQGSSKEPSEHSIPNGRLWALPSSSGLKSSSVQHNFTPEAVPSTGTVAVGSSSLGTSLYTPTNCAWKYHCMSCHGTFYSPQKRYTIDQWFFLLQAGTTHSVSAPYSSSSIDSFDTEVGNSDII